MRTEVVNIRATRLFGMHLDDVYVGRAGRGFDGYFGNPVRAGRTCPECGRTHEFAGSTLDCYERYLDRRLAEDPEFRRRVSRLRGKRLGCFCKPALCHGDLLAARADALPPRVVTVDFRLATPPIGDRAVTFARLLGLDPAQMRWTKTREGHWLASSTRRTSVRVDFTGVRRLEPCRCERGRHTQCRPCYHGMRHRCECAPCHARALTRPPLPPWNFDLTPGPRRPERLREIGETEYDDDYPSETEILGVVGDR